jgi:RNA polymerase sigma-70 factor (ECF subfamily)
LIKTVCVLEVRAALGFTITLDGQLSDEILSTRIAQGDVAAFELLYDRHAAMILGIAFRITGDQSLAEEILQETFWRVWQSARTYKPERGSLAGWLYRIAHNLAIDTVRRQRVRPQVIYEHADSNPVLDRIHDSEVDVAQQAQSNLDLQQVKHGLANLPREQRQVIEMAYFHGMTRQEIAKATGEALGTIHTRARLGLRKLREHLNRRVETERK